MKLCDALAQALLAEGVDTIFGLMGDGNMALWATLAGTGRVRLYSSRHEAAAISMAEGHARMTDGVGVATVTNGPGLTHAATPIISAARYKVPLVVLAGDSPPDDPLHVQRLDQRRFAEACEAKFISISSPDRALLDLREAFLWARVNRGPVVFNMPIPLLERTFVSGDPYRPSVDFLPSRPISPDPAALEPIVEALAKAQRPVIIAGRGAVAADAKVQIERLADRCGALLATSLPAKGYFEGHPFDVGICGGFSSAPAARLLRQADFVLAMGAGLNHLTSGGHDQFFDGATIARVDVVDPARIGTPLGLHLRADARLAAVALHDELERRQIRKTGYHTADTMAVIDQAIASPSPAADGLDPRRLMHELSAVLSARTLVNCGAGHFWTFPIQRLSLPEGGVAEFAYGFGEIGSGLPLAIGAAVGAPDRPHVLIDGDGSILQHLQELDTIVRYGLQMVIVIMNDSGFGAEFHKLKLKGFDSALATWTSPDFVAIAKAHGGSGTRLAREADIGDAVRQGLERGGLFVIDACISPTTASDYYRQVHFGEPNQVPLVRRVAGAGRVTSEKIKVKSGIPDTRTMRTPGRNQHA